MARLTGINSDTSKRYMFDAGVIYKNYNFATGTGTLLGATSGGVTFTIEREVRPVEVDGMLGKTKGYRRIISENASITAQLFEWTAENVKMSLAGTDSVVDGDYNKITCSRDIEDSDYIDNIVMVVKMPNNKIARFGLFNALCDEGLEIATTDEEESVPSVTFSAHYDPTADLDIRPYRIDIDVTVESPMILTFDTSLIGGNTVTLSVNGEVDVVVDWGDGSKDFYTDAGDKDHTYAEEGVYEVKIFGRLTHFGRTIESSTPNIAALVEVESFGDLGLTSLRFAFGGATNLTKVPDELPQTVTNINFMFRGANLFNGNIGEWNTENVTVMGRVFEDASSFNQDIKGWDVSGVTNMNGMFQNAVAFAQNIALTWNPESLTTASNMFTDATEYLAAGYDTDPFTWPIS